MTIRNDFVDGMADDTGLNPTANVNVGVHAKHHNDLANGINTLNATITATPSAGAIPLSNGSGKLAAGWTQLAISDLTDGATAERTTNKGSANGYMGLDANKLPAVANFGTQTILRTWESFGGTLTGNLAAQTAVWTSARAWLVANGGGTLFFGLGAYLHMPQMDLPAFTVLAGQGFMQTELQADSTLAAHFVQTHKSSNGTSDPNGIGCTIRDLALNCFFMGGWGTNPYDAIHFDRLPQFGTDPTILSKGGGSIVEPNQTVMNVLILNPPRDGIGAAPCMGGHLYQNVRTVGCGRYGFLPTFDSWLLTCSAASSLSHGFQLQVGPVRLVECVSYNSGNSAAHAAQGQGFFVDGSGGIAGSVALINCEAQDNFGDGFVVSGCPFASVALVGCLADSNSAGSVGTYPAFNILNSPYTRISGGRAVERKADGTNSWQRNAVSLTASSFCTIEVVHKAQDSGNGAATIGTPFLSCDTASVGCDVNINGLKGMQLPAFAASFTPDFYLGGVIELGLLTANLTINAPSNGPWAVGTRAEFILQQDGTGGRTITWNATYKNTPNTVTTASGYTTKTFRYDGTNWVGI